MTTPLATRHLEDGRATLRFERRLAHPPEKVWRALTDPNELAHWFPGKVELEPRPGAPMRFSELDPDIEESTGEVLEVDPPKLFAFRWDQDLLRFELEVDGAGCRLVFTHTLSGSELWGDEKFAAQHAAGWDACLDVLAARLTGPSADPVDDSMAAWFARNEEYVEEFGLAEGEVVADADGLVLRFERIVIPSPGDTWAALVGSADPVVGGPPPGPVTTSSVPAGPVIEIGPDHQLTYEWTHAGETAGWVRWLVTGRTYACRLVLTQSIPPELADLRADLLATWQVHLERLIASQHDIERPWSDERVGSLRTMYAERL